MFDRLDDILIRYQQILEELNDGLNLSPEFFDVCRKHIAGSKRPLMKDTSLPLLWNKRWDLYVPRSLRDLTDKGVVQDAV